MKVSIITATYNSAATVQHTIDSVMDQTYHSIEHIIVDGNSSDDTMDLVRNAGLKSQSKNTVSVSIFQGKDDGIYDALNKGISYATGEIIGILHSDDFYPGDDIIQKWRILLPIPGRMWCMGIYGMFMQMILVR